VSFAKPRQRRNPAAVCAKSCAWDYLVLFLLIFEKSLSLHLTCFSIERKSKNH